MGISDTLILTGFCRFWPVDAAQSVLLARTLKKWVKNGCQNDPFVLPKGPRWGFGPEVLDEGPKKCQKWVEKVSKIDTFWTTFWTLFKVKVERFGHIWTLKKRSEKCHFRVQKGSEKCHFRVQLGSNRVKWPENGQNGQKTVKMARNQSKWPENNQKWLKNQPKSAKMAKNQPKSAKNG